MTVLDMENPRQRASGAEKGHKPCQLTPGSPAHEVYLGRLGHREPGDAGREHQGQVPDELQPPASATDLLVQHPVGAQVQESPGTGSHNAQQEPWPVGNVQRQGLSPPHHQPGPDAAGLRTG